MPLLSDQTDGELMEAVRGGDTASLDALFTRHHERLFSFLARWTGDVHTAEDLLQETFLRLLLHPARYRHEEGNFRAWLIRVARNLAIDAYRHQIDQVPTAPETALADHQPLALERLTAQERSQHLDDALASLSLVHREVLLLRGVEGLGTREIGDMLNCSEGAVRVRLHRATTALRQAWRARHGEE